MEGRGSKRKAASEEEEARSVKRAKVIHSEEIETSYTVFNLLDTGDSNQFCRRMLVKEGKLKLLNEATARWTESDVTLKLYSNADLEYKIDLRSQDGELKKQQKKVRILSDQTAAPFNRTDYVGVFCIVKTKDYLAHRNEVPLIFAAADPNEGEKWMLIINYTRLKRTLELAKHNHPLTPCQPQFPFSAVEKVGPSVINLSNGSIMSCYSCETNFRISPGLRCEFCDFDICRECSVYGSTTPLNSISGAPSILSPSIPELERSANHVQHPLIRFDSVEDPSWFLQAKYNDGSYFCNVCSEERYGPVYHCMDCGDYEECLDCFRPVKTEPETMKSLHENEDKEMQLDVGLLSRVITKYGNVFELNKQSECKPPQAASMITTKCWDVSQIDSAPVPSAYFEVTFHHLEGQYVSVGVGNQIFVQNQLLGYQQNSFGYCNNGQATQNVGTNSQNFSAYGTGDTVGVGMLLDSFNMRRLYFTKNGQLLGCFNERVHVGMDCFPGVSFTPNTCQQLKFSVNTTGPFMFDPSSVLDYRSARHNWLEEMPNELIVKFLALAVQTSPEEHARNSTIHAKQAVEFFRVSKTISSVASNNEIWKPLFLQRWPVQNSQLKIKSWMKFYQSHYEAVKRKKTQNNFEYNNDRNFIENCAFEFECRLLKI